MAERGEIDTQHIYMRAHIPDLVQALKSCGVKICL